MTIKDAEEQYNIEILSCREQYLKHAKKAKLIWNIISAVLIITGIILTAIGFTTPPEIDSFGFEWEPIWATFEKCYGIGAICLGVFFFVLMNIFWNKAIKNGPRNFIQQIKNLYLNYLECEDMNKDDKEFYKQKLEDIRNMELANAIHNASATVSAAIMFSTLNR